MEISNGKTGNLRNVRSAFRVFWIAFALLALLGAGVLSPLLRDASGSAVYAARKIPAKTEQRAGVSGSVFSNDKASIDLSNMAEGYVLLKYTGGKSIPIKVQITKKGGDNYTYNLKNDGTVEVFPFSVGDGEYTINIFENVSGNKYALAFGKTVGVKLRDQMLPFMYSNQYVKFGTGSESVKQAASLAAGKATDLEKLEAVYRYVITNLSYDKELAKNAPAGYVPDVDAVLQSKKGICFDYAAVMSAMLRSQNIPCKLVIGYAGTAYHAWVNVFVESVGWIDKAIYFDGEKFSLMDPTFASSSNASPDIYKFIGDGSNYKVKYTD
ncbi:MAG: transglutaminase-like domain-containing protein [Clostridiales Family XIII bacterium]|nr:transglutaminase-like domain-containing protein [Clostridiales Family XIII bacterium]